MAEGMRALRHHVTAMDDYQYERLPEGVVMGTITHSNLIQKHVELRFDLHSTVMQLMLCFTSITACNYNDGSCSMFHRYMQ